jgi:uncharacterized protein (TIGR02453 family)
MSGNNLKPVLFFLAELSRNNNRPWFESHREAYNSARSAFEELIDDLIEKLEVTDNLQGLTARECITRIFRDIRFSKDKTPYKANMAAHIAPGGWKTTSMGYYVSIEPLGASLVGGGLHDPTPEQLDRFRRAISEDASEYKHLTDSARFVEMFAAVEGDRLKTAPKGYDRAHPELDILRLKQVMVIHHFSDEQVLAAEFEDRVLDACQVMKPLLEYLKRFM